LLFAIVQCESLQRRRLALVADASCDPECPSFHDRSAVRPGTCLQDGFGFERRGVKPGEACRAAVGDEHLSIIGDSAGHVRNLLPGSEPIMFVSAPPRFDKTGDPHFAKDILLRCIAGPPLRSLRP
jgi:hypothetical protein